MPILLIALLACTPCICSEKTHPVKTTTNQEQLKTTKTSKKTKT